MTESQHNNFEISLIQDYLKRSFVGEEPDQTAVINQFRVFSLLYEKLTEAESIEFTTLFSRIAYTAIKYKFPGRFTFLNHSYRRTLEKKTKSEVSALQLYETGYYLINKILFYVYDIPLTADVTEPIYFQDVVSSSQDGTYERSVRGIALSINEASSSLDFIPENKGHLSCEIQIKDESLSKHLNRLKKYIQFPIHVNLIDSQVDGQVYYPKSIVLDPDFLIGVTSISECYEASGYTSLKYLSRKLIAGDMSVHMLIGNIVNFYLDELINNPDIEFKSLMQDIFKLSPVFFADMTDDDLSQLISKVHKHFLNLKRVVKRDLASSGINKEKTYLEPSFYSNEYGIQGRLDLYHYEESKSQSHIVELKSGKLFKANSYGINNNHYMQTLLYDLIIESIYQGKVKSNSFILYSSLDDQNLRHAPKIRNKQLDAVKLRNEIIALEYILANLNEETNTKFLDFLNPKNLDESFHFLRRDAGVYYKALKSLNPLELSYYTHYVGFVSREYRLSKTGEHGIHRSNGLASLWLDPLEEKQQSFRILSFLTIAENHTDSDDPCLTLEYSPTSNKLSRFRPGDIVVFYPHGEGQMSPLRNQVFKSTLIEVTQDSVTIRLRARQKNFEVFDKSKYWHLEGDVLDGGFNMQLHSLYHFIGAKQERRALLLGQKAPSVPQSVNEYNQIGLTENQLNLVRSAIVSPDYYLIWGPPGTGKTSVIIRSLVDHYYNSTDSNILLLAYTNRAVDEICNAISEVTQEDFIRIGSRYSTSPEYKKHLLQEAMSNIDNRKELSHLLQQQRLFVSTISSFLGKNEIKRIKKFDVVIIDEASQLLEPMLIGLLAHCTKFILIGDHKQLPAVVAQSDKKSYTNDALLRDKLGVTDLRMSLFERMYKQCQNAEWSWSYGSLIMQGRMHSDILEFVTTEFYGGELRILPHVRRLTATPKFKVEIEKQRILVNNRMLFLDTPADKNVTEKTNIREAELVVDIILEWEKIYKNNQQYLNPKSIGVITPFRSQIALIKKMLSVHPSLNDIITVDTIERYQGGARDIIIYSMAVNQADALQRISNISEEGIDRKLNVALTRAKEHIVVLGAQKIVSYNKPYRNLMESCFNVSFDVYLNH
jgi:DNA replication ATP-dependent helicase Dna2